MARWAKSNPAAALSMNAGREAYLCWELRECSNLFRYWGQMRTHLKKYPISTSSWQLTNPNHNHETTTRKWIINQQPKPPRGWLVFWLPTITPEPMEQKKAADWTFVKKILIYSILNKVGGWTNFKSSKIFFQNFSSFFQALTIKFPSILLQKKYILNIHSNFE